LIDNALNVEYLTTNATTGRSATGSIMTRNPARSVSARPLPRHAGPFGDNYDVLIANSMFTARTGTPGDSVMRFHALRLNSQP
jgi:hypothetical protein